MELTHSLPIYGRVHSLNVLRPPHAQMDLLWLMTGDFKCAIVCYDMQDRALKTLWNDNLGRFYETYAEHTQTCKVDATSTYVGVSLSDLFRVLKLNYELLLFDPLRGFSGSLSIHLFSLPMEVRNVIDYDYLQGVASEVTVAVLYSDANHARHVRLFDLHLKDEGQILDSSATPVVCSDPFTVMLVPAPDRALLTFSERAVCFHRARHKQVLTLDGSAVPVACGHISPTEFIVGDRLGRLFLLRLETNRKGYVSLVKIDLGVTSQASAITKLAQLEAPEGVAHLVFISSCFGDSQLLTVIPTNSASSKIEVVRSFTNMGPIVDFALVPRKDSENTEIVACSGTGRDGAVSIIRNGITFVENASFEQAGVMNVWALREDLADQYDAYLVFSFVNETRIMRLAEESREAHIPGFDGDSPSLCVANLQQGLLLQVTPRSVRLVARDSGALKEEWRCPEQRELTLAAASTELILVASGSRLFLLGQTPGATLRVLAQRDFANDLSALTLHTGGERANHAAISLWKEHLVLLLAIPSLEILAEWPLGGEILCRSLSLQRLEGRDFLFAGLGDGTLCYTTADLTANRLGQRAVLSLGSQQLILRSFEFSKRNFIFVCSDRPCVILLKEGKIHVAQVNLQHVPRACPLRSPVFKDTAMVICTTTNSLVKICSIGDIQKLHIRKIPIGETPRRITYCPRAELCAVLSDTSQGPVVRLVNATIAEVGPALMLGATRIACAITCCHFEDDEREFVVVSLAEEAAEALPERGALMVYHLQNQQLVFVSRTATAGLGYALEPFQRMLLASCNSQLLLYAWHTDTLMLVTSIDTHIMLLSVQTLGDHLLVGDLIQSVSLLVYHPLEAKFELRATEPSCSLALATDFVSPLAQSCMVADSKQTLHLVRILDVDEVEGIELIEPAAPPERMRVESSFCAGEVIHRLRRGQLVRLEGRHSAGELVFATMNGSIGVVAMLSEPRFTFLDHLQTLLLPHVTSVGNFSHRLYRHPAGSPGEHTFIDGDLIARFLELRPPLKERLAAEMGTTAEELAAEIELFHQRLA